MNFVQLEATYDQYDSSVRTFWKAWMKLSKKKRKTLKKEMRRLLTAWAFSTMLHRDIAETLEKDNGKDN